MISIDEMKEFLGGDEDFILSLMEKFILEAEKDLDKLRSAVDKKNWSMVKAIAHKMQSSTRIFGFDQLSNALERLEVLSEEKRELDKMITLVSEIEMGWKKVEEETKEVKDKLKV